MGKHGQRHKNDILVQQMDDERSSFLPHWRDLGDFTLTRRARFTITDVNKGGGRNSKIINNTAVRAARTLSSGMMAGITSPSRAWFKLTLSEDEADEPGAVKEWLQEVSKRMRSIFRKSNIYNILPTTYKDLGTFATGCIFMEEDFERVVHFFSIPIGSYMIANDEKLRVRVFYRELRMTVRQIIEKFGRVDGQGKPDWSNISQWVRDMWEKDLFESWVDVCHMVKPNENYNPKMLESKFKKYISQYYEKGSDQNRAILNENDTFLRQRGYTHFPLLVPRWEVTGEDSWGTDCPGMVALGDNKSLQKNSKLKAQAVEKMVKPALTGPNSLRNKKVSILPGDIVYDDVREGQKGLRPTHIVDPKTLEIREDIKDDERRIEQAYYVDLFLAITNSDRREVTAREIDEQHEEKLLGLGPVLENIDDELLDPLIENTFQFGFEQGKFPEPPEELQGKELKIEYIGIMAQAQKIGGIANVERFLRFVGELSTSSGDESVWHKVDKMEAIDDYANRLGIDATIVVPDDEVVEILEAERKAAEAQALLAGVDKLANTAETLSKADLEGNNALKQIVGTGR